MRARSLSVVLKYSKAEKPARALLHRTCAHAPLRLHGWKRTGPDQRSLDGELTAMHCLMMHDCFIRPGPPNFFMSLQKWHSPHSVRRHASHLRQRVLRLLAPEVPRLADSLTADAGEAAILDLGRLGGRG